MNYEARIRTFSEMHEFVQMQWRYLEQDDSAREFEKLVVETESRLLRETADWFSRRAFTGLASTR